MVWACCRNSTPWCSNAMKLCKQHRAGTLSRSLGSPPVRRGSLFKINVILCVVASAGLVRAAHARLRTSHDRPSCSAAPLLPLSFPPSHKASSGARTSSAASGSAPWARRSSIAATWPFTAAQWKAVMPFCEGARKGTRHGRCSEHEIRAAQHRRGARPGATSVGSGVLNQQG